MREIKHTQGTWNVSDVKINEDFGNQKYFSIQPNRSEIVGEGDNKTYKTVGFFYPHSVQSEEEMIANAKLMASAPLLLQSLKEASIILEKTLAEFKYALGNHCDMLKISKEIINKNSVVVEATYAIKRIEELLS